MIKPSLTAQIYYSPMFRETAIVLGGSDPNAWAGIRRSIDYLIEHGRASVRPDVGWHIRESSFGPNSGEVRWPDPEYQSEYSGKAWRGLFVSNRDCDWIVFGVLGNKVASPGGTDAWYRDAARETDEFARTVHNAANLPNFQNE